MEFTIMEKNDEMAEVAIRDGKLLTFKLLPASKKHPFFASEDIVTYATIFSWLEDRCVPPERPNIKELLASIGLDEYNVFEIVKRTHGVIYDDFEWMRFKGESIVWEDVKIRD